LGGAVSRGGGVAVTAGRPVGIGAVARGSAGAPGATRGLAGGGAGAALAVGALAGGAVGATLDAPGGAAAGAMVAGTTSPSPRASAALGSRAQRVATTATTTHVAATAAIHNAPLPRRGTPATLVTGSSAMTRFDVTPLPASE
jgi:hypothetical protein